MYAVRKVEGFAAIMFGKRVEMSLKFGIGEFVSWFVFSIIVGILLDGIVGEMYFVVVEIF